MDTLPLAQSLAGILGNTAVFAKLTHNFHLNYSGPGFIYLHPFLGADYEDMQAAVDPLSEFLRSLGYYSPASFTEYLRLANRFREPTDMVTPRCIAYMEAGHMAMGEMCKETFHLTEDCNDLANFLAERQGYHYKQAWFYRAEQGGASKSLHSRPPLQSSLGPTMLDN